MDSKYDDHGGVRRAVEQGQRRALIGGLWNELGSLQLSYLKSAGLSPDHCLLDVGCGSLRAGVHLAAYLAAGHYFGIDNNESLLEAGYAEEIIPVGLASRVPRSNLACIDNFDASRFHRRFDMALAQSVFTHLSFNRIRLCLENLAGSLVPGGVFHATFFPRPRDQASGIPITHSGGTRTFRWRDPYHYSVDDFVYAIRNLPWQLEYIGDWGHPMGQEMLRFTKLD